MNYGYINQKKNYFPMPNPIFLFGLTAGEIAVYCYLMYCEDRKTFECYPSFSSIGKALKISKNTVRKYVLGLENKGLITIKHTKIITKDGQKRNGNLLYKIRSMKEVLSDYYGQPTMKLSG